MTITSHPHGRIGAEHRAKLKKWSDRIAREANPPVVGSVGERLAVRRRRTLDAARKKLRKLFQ
jgi:hypothetical protein